jgi:hypothetical protein
MDWEDGLGRYGLAVLELMQFVYSPCRRSLTVQCWAGTVSSAWEVSDEKTGGV